MYNTSNNPPPQITKSRSQEYIYNNNPQGHHYARLTNIIPSQQSSSSSTTARSGLYSPNGNDNGEWQVHYASGPIPVIQLSEHDEDYAEPLPPLMRPEERRNSVSIIPTLSSYPKPIKNQRLNSDAIYQNICQSTPLTKTVTKTNSFYSNNNHKIEQNEDCYKALMLSPIFPSGNDRSSVCRSPSHSPDNLGNIWHEIEICMRDNTNSPAVIEAENSDIYVTNNNVLSNTMIAFDENEFAVENNNHNDPNVEQWRIERSSSIKTARLISNTKSIRQLKHDYWHDTKGVHTELELGGKLYKKNPQTQRIKNPRNNWDRISDNELSDAVCQTPETCVDTGIQTDQYLKRYTTSSDVGCNTTGENDEVNETTATQTINNNNNSMIMFNHLGVI